MKTSFILLAQTKYLYFDYLQNSLKARSLCAAAPANLQSFSVNNSLVTDYVDNTRISLNTGVLTSKKDTTLALHNLVNDVVNFALEAEYPFWVKRTRIDNITDLIRAILFAPLSAPGKIHKLVYKVFHKSPYTFYKLSGYVYKSTKQYFELHIIYSSINRYIRIANVSYAKMEDTIAAIGIG